MIQKGQEDYMDAAWDQVGDVLEANHRIRLAHYARYAGVRMHLRHVKAKRDVSPGGLILMQAPVAARLVSRGITVHYQVKQSPMSPAMGSVAMRRYLRPGGKIAKRLGLTGPLDVGQVVTRANEGEITATPPKLPPEHVLTPDDLAGAAESGVPPQPQGPLDQIANLLFAPPINGLVWLMLLVIALLLLLFLGATGLILVAAMAGPWSGSGSAIAPGPSRLPRPLVRICRCLARPPICPARPASYSPTPSIRVRRRPAQLSGGWRRQCAGGGLQAIAGGSIPGAAGQRDDRQAARA
jgi:hypothetical protein